MKTLMCFFVALMPMGIFAQSIEIEGAYAFQPNPAAKNGAIFMQIYNHSDEEIRLIDAKGEGAKRVQLHSHEMDGDVMKMVHLEDGLAIPANGCVALERGGYHVMLMGLTRNLQGDEAFDLELDFDNGEMLHIEVLPLGEQDLPEADEHCVRSGAAMTMDMSEAEHSH